MSSSARRLRNSGRSSGSSVRRRQAGGLSVKTCIVVARISCARSSAFSRPARTGMWGPTRRSGLMSVKSVLSYSPNMIDEELIPTFKALAERSRLRIVGLLAGGHWMAVEDIAAALALTPGTIVHHLNRLRAAGLVESRPRPPYVGYSRKIGRLAEIGARLDRIERQARSAGEEEVPADMPAWAEAKDVRVLRAFF